MPKNRAKRGDYRCLMWSSRVPEARRHTEMGTNGPQHDAVWLTEHRLVRAGNPVTVFLGYELGLRNTLLIKTANDFNFEQKRAHNLDKLVFLSTDSNTRGFSYLSYLMNRNLYLWLL